MKKQVLLILSAMLIGTSVSAQVDSMYIFKNDGSILSMPTTLIDSITFYKADEEGQQDIKLEKLTGVVQKGPFINGTSISISELTPELIQTGKIFTAQILDNKGSFEIKQVELSSQFVELKADGYYFNEVTGNKSASQLTLYALSDLSDKTGLNVNVMSHLEKNRIDFLISERLNFEGAKSQAQQEILEIFSFTKTDMQESELLDISKDGEDNAILLAVSVILQGFRTDAGLSELLANINTDIREDGILNSTSIGTELINHALLLNLPAIRQNLVDRYDEMGISATIPGFEKYVQLFIDSTDYEFTNLIKYPEFSDYGENILYADKDTFNSNTIYSLAAELPEGTDLKIKLSGGIWYFNVIPDGPKNWTVSQYNEILESQTFTSTESGKNCNLKLKFEVPYVSESDSTDASDPFDIITIDYFENLSTEPTKTKNIVIINPE